MRGVQIRRSRCGSDKKALLCVTIEDTVFNKAAKKSDIWTQVKNTPDGIAETMIPIK
jgi:hypothetical protein